MPDIDLSTSEPWLDAARRSHDRREAALRVRRRRRSARTVVGVALASLTLASGGALAATATTATVAKKASRSSSRTTLKAVQRALGLKADGVMGPKTRRAIRRFQKAHGLKVDGIAGSATRAALGITRGSSKRRSLESAPANTGATTAPAPVAGGDAGAKLQKIAQCESGDDPTAVSDDGTYRGKYQFDQGTWESMGGTGDPARADEATQDAIALKLYAAKGTTPWPACGAGA